MHTTNSLKQKKALLMVSLLVNLGLLGFFKYFNFFIESWVSFMDVFGVTSNWSTLNILLPIGISFYTFQTLSYTIDIYKGNLKPTKDFIAFSAFISFFPQLVAGPIERASNLLPQFLKERQFDYERARKGGQLILYGLFKKMVIADRLAEIVNIIYDPGNDFGGVITILGAVLFAFQIYCDFAGYSDIAIGTAKLFGFDLKTNFQTPFISTSITEFWRRWHISLYSWFTDYLYTPLVIAFRDFQKTGIAAAILLTFLISGLWHGAGWKFIIYGGLHGVYLIVEFLTKKKRKRLKKKMNPWIHHYGALIITFMLVVISWVFFRANSLSHSIEFFADCFNFDIPIRSQLTKIFSFEKVTKFSFTINFLLLFIFILMEKFVSVEASKNWLNQRVFVRYGAYITVIFIIAFFGVFRNQSEFIYFQF